jgi:tellurite resistance protein
MGVFDRKAAIKQAIADGSVPAEQLEIWAQLFHSKNKLSDADIDEIGEKLPGLKKYAAKVKEDKKAAEEAALKPVKKTKITLKRGTV